MAPLVVAEPRLIPVRIARCASVAALACALLTVPAGSQEMSRSSALRGTVHDSQGKPIASAAVHLQSGEGTPALTASTDAQGNYSFSAVREGVYSLRAQMPGFADAVIRSIFLAANGVKNVDLTLTPAKTDSSKPAPSSALAFFEEPQFTISGVTDTTGLGGHGSDTIVRTRETLARETASLGETSAPSNPGPSAASEESLRQQAEHEPKSFAANHAFGTALLTNGKARQAIPYLERAAQINPEEYENSFELALANSTAGNRDLARQQAQTLLVHHDTAELHHLLADIQERLGKPLEAVREFQRAAELDPSEPYLFDWGSELLLHHAPEPALGVFTQANRRFPRSARILIGLGAACFARGDYDQAVQQLRQASDLTPDDPTPYSFLGKIAQAQSQPSDDLVEGLRRFVALHPESAAANYYYAVAWWKRRKSPHDPEVAAHVQSLLQNAIRLDPNFAPAYLQLGILDSERRRYPSAIAAFQQAIKSSPELEEAHYRLAQAYRETGRTDEAKTELQLHDQMAKESAEKAERERRDLRQFLYTLRDQPSSHVQ